MKITMIAALSIATAATALPLAAIAHGDPTIYKFLSPSGNIGCAMEDDGSTVFAVCKTQDSSWAAPPSQYCQLAEVPGATGGPGSAVQLSQGKTPCAGFSMDQIFLPPDPLADDYPTLASGQTHSVGAITCDSELSSVTCTDSSTGHFFRASRDSYQLG